LICSANAELAPKFSFTVTPGCAVSNCLANVVKVPSREAAANTVTVPDTAGALDVTPPLAAVEVLVVPVDPLLEELQPATSMTAAAAQTPMARILRCIAYSLVRCDR
jgi:hypothetical protein